MKPDPAQVRCLQALHREFCRIADKNKEEIPTIWEELGAKIGRRGSLQVNGLFEMGCGANLSARIDAAKYPTEAAKLWVASYTPCLPATLLVGQSLSGKKT